MVDNVAIKHDVVHVECLICEIQNVDYCWVLGCPFLDLDRGLHQSHAVALEPALEPRVQHLLQNKAEVQNYDWLTR
jgi:hypothetical protein